MSRPGHRILRVLHDPHAGWQAIRARFRGLVFTWWCHFCRRRISIGRGLVLEGKLKIRGKGRVIIGNNVVIGMSVTPFTYGPDAVIRIGDGAFLNGTRFGCREKILVGERSILAECRITDWDFHSTDPAHRHDPEHSRSAPITIEDNVWVTVDCVVLKGTTIGRNTTISANSVVRDSIPPNSIAGGNPAVVWKRLDSK